MNPSVADKKSTLTTLIVFLVILGGASALAHFALVYLVPTSLYVGALMMTPALAAFATLKLRGGKISALPWSWGGFGANWAGYLIPVLYISVSYALVWFFGFGGVGDGVEIEHHRVVRPRGQSLDVSQHVVYRPIEIALATEQLLLTESGAAAKEAGAAAAFTCPDIRSSVPHRLEEQRVCDLGKVFEQSQVFRSGATLHILDRKV